MWVIKEVEIFTCSLQIKFLLIQTSVAVQEVHRNAE